MILEPYVNYSLHFKKNKYRKTQDLPANVTLTQSCTDVHTEDRPPNLKLLGPDKELSTI